MIVFGKKECQGCRLSQKMLDQFGVSYTYVDVEEDEEGMALVTSLGYKTLPVIYVSETEHFSGFLPDRLRGLK